MINDSIKTLLSYTILLLEIGMLLQALRVTLSPSVKGVIISYRSGLFLLAAVTGLTAIPNLNKPGNPWLFLALIVLLPFTLAFWIEWFLSGATVELEPIKSKTDFVWKLFTLNWKSPKAEKIWRKNETQIQIRTGVHFIAFSLLTALAFVVAFSWLKPPSTSDSSLLLDERTGIMVSLALHLLGLYNTFVKTDIISQVSGLFVMDQGLFLAVVKIVAIPVPATFFVVSLYFYTLITLVILLVLVPRVRQKFETIDLDEISNNSSLKG